MSRIYTIALILIILAIPILTIAFASGFLTSNINKNSGLINSDSPTVTTLPTNTTLNISSPDNNKLVFDSQVLVAGTTTPNSTILISLEDQELILESDNKGAFSMTVTLEEGLNTLQIARLDLIENNKVEKRIVYYSEEKI